MFPTRLLCIFYTFVPTPTLETTSKSGKGIIVSFSVHPKTNKRTYQVNGATRTIFYWLFNFKIFRYIVEQTEISTPVWNSLKNQFWRIWNKNFGQRMFSPQVHIPVWFHNPIHNRGWFILKPTNRVVLSAHRKNSNYQQNYGYFAFKQNRAYTNKRGLSFWSHGPNQSLSSVSEIFSLFKNSYHFRQRGGKFLGSKETKIKNGWFSIFV